MEASMIQENDERDLKCLLDAFGSMFSLKEIASAYRQAGKRSDLAGEILFGMHKSISTSSSTSVMTEEVKGEDSSESSSNGKLSDNVFISNGESKAPKQKKAPVSMGTVSCFIGKDYVRPRPLANGSCVTTKPLKLDMKEFPKEEIWENEAFADKNSVNKDMEDFLFKILGDGFQMDRNVIREVLACCGYDMQKSMDKLLDMSGESFGKSSNDHHQPPKKFTGTSQKMDSSASHNKLPCTNNSRSSGKQRGKSEIEKELMASLFNPPERPIAVPVRTRGIMAPKRSTALHVVKEPFPDTTPEHELDFNYRRQNGEDDLYEDDGYQDLRQAVKEYRVTMKEYYRAAVKAFAEGDSVKSENLLQKGHFFHQKAREADEESAQKIFETRNVEEHEVFTLDLHEDGVKEAMRLLKCHLSSLSGIPSFKYLKIIMETTDEDVTKGALKRRIMKLLEKESITWIEEGTPGTILICLENINHQRLSFATKP